MVTATLRSASKDAAVTNAVQTTSEKLDVGAIDVKSTVESLFADSQQEQQTSPTPTAVVPRQTFPVAPPSAYTDESGGTLEGEWDQSDLKFPTLMIVQGASGPLVEKYSAGDLVFGEELLLKAPRKNEPCPVVKFVPIKIEKSFRENLSPEAIAAGEMPRLAKTIREVEELGGSTRWIGNDRPSWQPSAKCVFLIQLPDGSEHPGFALDFDDKLWAVGLYYAKTGAYNATAQNIFNCYQTSLFVPALNAEGKEIINPVTNRPLKKRLLYRNVWSWTWGTVKAGNFNPWRPRVTLTKEETSPAVRDFCAELLGTSQTVQSDAD